MDNQIVKAASPAMKDLLKVTEGDKERLVKLNNLRSVYILLSLLEVQFAYYYYLHNWILIISNPVCIVSIF